MLLPLMARQARRDRALLLALMLLSLSLCLIALLWGETWLLPWHSALAADIFWQLRLPRALLALLVGAALAGGGATLQVLLQNPLAEPSLLGVSSGAGLLAMLTLTLSRQGALGSSQATPWLVALAAFTGAMAVSGLLLWLARRHGAWQGRLLLLGVAIGLLTQAAMTWLFYWAEDGALREYMFWLMGSLAQASSHVMGQDQAPWLALWALVAGVLVWLSRQGPLLAQLHLGELHAELIGVAVAPARRRLLLAVCLLTGAVVALCGVIGFIGLLVPHLLRLLGVSAQRLLPLSLLGGSALLLLADLLARHCLTSGELPLGVVTASVGAPMLIWLLMRAPHAN
ncbi:MAG: iron chelate uptake ABC transporter family permease subunit [Aeromonas sp.]